MQQSLRIKLLSGLMLGAMLTSPISRPISGQGAALDQLKLKVGDQAPDFKLQFFTGNDLKDVHLSDYRGKKNVVLAFYVFAFTGG